MAILLRPLTTVQAPVTPAIAWHAPVATPQTQPYVPPGAGEFGLGPPAGSQTYIPGQGWGYQPPAAAPNAPYGSAVPAGLGFGNPTVPSNAAPPMTLSPLYGGPSYSPGAAAASPSTQPQAQSNQAAPTVASQPAPATAQASQPAASSQDVYGWSRSGNMSVPAQQQAFGNTANQNMATQAPQNVNATRFGLNPLSNQATQNAQQPSNVAPTMIGWGGYQGSNQGQNGVDQSGNQNTMNQQQYQQNLGGLSPTSTGYQRGLVAGS